jgi:4-hydroxybenzoate polyprenyltransferase
MIAAAGYIINDYYDVKIDYINKPERVVVGKSIPRRFAILFHVVLSVAGIGIGIYLSWWIGLIHVFSVFMLWLYSNILKRLPFIGNFVVGLLTGLSIIVVDVLFNVNDFLVVIYAIFAFFMTLVREIIKDMEDLKGDGSFGCKTLPIVLGIRKTKIIVYLILLLFLLSVLLINYYYVHLQIIYFVILLLIPVIFLKLRLYRADTVRDFRILSNFCKLIMLLGVLSMALL